MNASTPLLKIFTRGALLAAVICAPLLAVQNVNASTDTFIGEAPTMSNGAGLVLVFGLRRS
jgi:hypothetical protein